MNATTKLVIVAVVCVVLGFFGGYEYQIWHASKAAPAGQFGQGGRGAGGPNASGARRFGAGGGARPVIGSIVNIDDSSMTIKQTDGSTRIVLFSTNTTYTQSQTAAKTDLKVGTQVGAFGTDNSDGSLTAQSVQVNPQFMGRGAGGAGGQGQAGQPSPSASPASK